MLAKQIRARYPALKLVAGIWGFKGDAEKAKARFERSQPDRLFASLAQAIEQIAELTNGNMSTLEQTANGIPVSS